MNNYLTLSPNQNKLLISFFGKLTLYTIGIHEKQLATFNFSTFKSVVINLEEVSEMDTAAAIFIMNLSNRVSSEGLDVELSCSSEAMLQTLRLIKKQKQKSLHIPHAINRTLIDAIGKKAYSIYKNFSSFLSFLGKLFSTKIFYLKSLKNIRFKEIAFEINESAIKALGIIALTSFLIGVVVAYQSAFQLKIYGANIFIVDMLGISILRELSPLITAIVIAGRSGSAYTAQIGAMKITEELDAMKTMGFDPYIYLYMPRIIALMLAMPILIFVSDIMAVIGGMVVANLDLGITTDLFLKRFNDVVAAKHFFIGIVKGPFFAFLIATIGIYRGMMVKNDTQSIGFNTTKSVVEAIFAVIVCDAIFSIAFTNLGI